MIRFGRRDDRVSAHNVTAYRLAAADTLLRGYQRTGQLLDEATAACGHPWRAGEPVGLRLALLWAVQCCLITAERMTVACQHEDGGEGWLPAAAATRIEDLYRHAMALAVPVEQALAAAPGQGAPPVLPMRLSDAWQPGPGRSGARPAGVLPAEAEVVAVLAAAEAVTEQVATALAQVVPGAGLPGELHPGAGLSGELRPLAGLPGELRPWADRLRQRATGLRATLDQQRGLWLGRPDGAVLAELHHRLLGVISDGFRLGQAVLLPRLEDPTFTVRADRVAAAPGGVAERERQRMRQWLGFDPAALTAPELRAGLDVDRLRQLDAFWRADPAPQATVALQRRLDAEHAAGRLRRRGTETLRECPWSPVFLATETVDVGERIGRGTIFALRPGLVGGVFTHEVLRLGTDPSGLAGSGLSRQASQPAGAGLAGPASPLASGLSGAGLAGPASPLASGLSGAGPARTASQPASGLPSGLAGAGLWRLTDAEVVTRRAGEPGAVAALTRLWAADDDPATTAALLGQVRDALAAGSIRRRSRKALWTCPWPSTYLAVRRLSLGGERIGAGEVFAFTVTADDDGFARRIVRIGRTTLP